MKFSINEKRDLVLAGLMISAAFAILLIGGYKSLIDFNHEFLRAFGIAFFTAGIGFLLHEVMHKFVAVKYGLWAEFKAFYNMLWLALLFSLFGFIIAAPGAVFISGRGLTRVRNGKISLAGPLTNIVLALGFLIGLLVLGQGGWLGLLFEFGLSVNSLLAAFNMIPVMPFDGAKILAWDRGIYLVVTLIAIGLFIRSLVV